SLQSPLIPGVATPMLGPIPTEVSPPPDRCPQCVLPARRPTSPTCLILTPMRPLQTRSRCPHCCRCLLLCRGRRLCLWCLPKRQPLGRPSRRRCLSQHLCDHARYSRLLKPYRSLRRARRSSRCPHWYLFAR